MPRLYIEENNASRELVGFTEIFEYLKEQVNDATRYVCIMIQFYVS